MFYIIEKQNQLDLLSNLGDCFIHFIGNNDNYHPVKQNLTLIYLRPLNDNKGYILSINHNEAFSLDIDNIYSFLFNNTNKLFVLNKKQTMYFYKHNLYDINFIQNIKIEINNYCYSYFYNKFVDNIEINKIIPISKHYEIYEDIFNKVKNIIHKFDEDDEIYKFNNNELTEAYFYVENNGIKLNKNSYIEHYLNKIETPQYNIINSKIYSEYHLYSKTSRPSNSFNNINFAALNKKTGERKTFINENSILAEIDYSLFHPNIILKLIGINKPNNINLLDWIGLEKKEIYSNLYGGIEEKNLDHPYFKQVQEYIEYIWNNQFEYKTKTRVFNWILNKEIDDMYKLLSYILQSYETYYSVLTINLFKKHFENKKSKIILTTFDSFLIDLHKDEEDIFNKFKNELSFPFKIKTGYDYHTLVGQDS